MNFTLQFTQQANYDLDELERDAGLKKRLKAVRKALAYLESNPRPKGQEIVRNASLATISRHPSLNTHKFTTLQGPNGEEVFEAYAESKTPAAYRIFWHYGPGKHVITIIAITPHP
jgi:hypothetical protein